MLTRDVSRGWVPNADAVGAPANALLRMDNCVHDEQGVLALRRGSAHVTSVLGADIDVHSLYTATLNGTRYRMAGAQDTIYANESAIVTGVAGSGDIAFGSALGQVLAARSTTKKKYNGTTARTWGIAAPNAASTLTALAADSKVFASCASTESPIMTVNEGTLAFQPNRAGTANAAVELTPNATTGRATATKTFATATDFTVYDAAQVGVDTDLIEFYAYVTEPEYMDAITLMVDVNDGTFELDYYEFRYVYGDATPVPLDAADALASDYTAEGTTRRRVEDTYTRQGRVASAFRRDKPVSNAGWNLFSVARGRFDRHGHTAGKNWSTVKAVRVSVVGRAGGSAAAVRLDEIAITGGAERPYTGRYKVAVVGVYNSGTYTGKSAPSALSAELEVKASGLTVTVPAGVVNALDSQVTELWVYLMGGTLDGFYRAAVKTGGPFSGVQTINVITSERDLLITNLRLERTNTTPPDDIVGIAGPHYDRVLCLTAQFVYPSQPLNLDSFDAGQGIRVGDASETAYWIEQIQQQVYVGTSKDIYVLDGDWTARPDGSLNVLKRGLGLSHPPIGKTVARDGSMLVYLAGDGWRVLGAETAMMADVDLLYRGQTRHGVSAVNLSTGRFRAALVHGVLTAITPEGASTTDSRVLHRFDVRKGRWYRHTYPTAWRSLHVEQDGTLLAGGHDGYVWQLDTGTLDHATAIPVVVWTPVLDDGKPVTPKDLTQVQTTCDVGGGTLSLAVHLDGASVPATTVTTTASSLTPTSSSLTAVASSTRVQLRMTGDLSTFRFYQAGVTYVDEPMITGTWDSGPVDLGTVTTAFVGELWVKAAAPNGFTATPYFDGAATTARTVTSRGTVATEYRVPLGREDRGRQARVVITGTNVQVYWCEFRVRGAGSRLGKPVRVAA